MEAGGPKPVCDWQDRKLSLTLECIYKWKEARKLGS